VSKIIAPLKSHLAYPFHNTTPELFFKYLHIFETKFIPEGLRKGTLGKSWLISIRDGKLSGTAFGQLLGSTVDSVSLFALDYYGHIKKSKGLILYINSKLIALKGRQLKKVEAPIVHFASITIEDISEITEDPLIITKFSEFKQILLKNRGYLKNDCKGSIK